MSSHLCSLLYILWIIAIKKCLLSAYMLNPVWSNLLQKICSWSCIAYMLKPMALTYCILSFTFSEVSTLPRRHHHPHMRKSWGNENKSLKHLFFCFEAAPPEEASFCKTCFILIKDNQRLNFKKKPANQLMRQSLPWMLRGEVAVSTKCIIQLPSIFSCLYSDTRNMILYLRLYFSTLLF